MLQTAIKGFGLAIGLHTRDTNRHVIDRAPWLSKGLTSLGSILSDEVYASGHIEEHPIHRQMWLGSLIIRHYRRRVFKVSGHNGQVVGYVRVSANDQNPARQLEAVGVVDKLFSEKASGKNAHERVQLQAMLAYVRKGDKIRVKSLDRLARSTTDLLSLVERLKADEVVLEFIDTPALNTDTPQGEFMLTVLAAIAQLERQTIRERQAEGIAIAKKNGVYDRKPKLTPCQIKLARQRLEQGVAKSKIARDLNISRQTLYAALSGSGKYAGFQDRL